MTRHLPYTQIGIRRVPCARCGKPSRFQWNICADKQPGSDRTIYRGLCADCDIELNEMVMRWIWGDRRDTELQRYAALVRNTAA